MRRFLYRHFHKRQIAGMPQILKPKKHAKNNLIPAASFHPENSHFDTDLTVRLCNELNPSPLPDEHSSLYHQNPCFEFFHPTEILRGITSKKRRYCKAFKFRLPQVASLPLLAFSFL